VRTTLINPVPTRHSPFGGYKTHTREPLPLPLRLAQQRLGISEEELERRIADEIDELFQEIGQEHRLVLLETLPFERVLSKEDCIRMFSAPGTSVEGHRLGILKWATDSAP
jgi:hypothetical protein